MLKRHYSLKVKLMMKFITELKNNLSDEFAELEKNYWENLNSFLTYASTANLLSSSKPVR